MRDAERQLRVRRQRSTAYQIGLQIGTNLGLVMNQAAAKKHTWEARAYWQSIALNSLDPNLTDSDFFVSLVCH